MESPFYGRTGLLDSGRDGVPVQRPRLLPVCTPATAAPVAPSLKWAPTMLTVPQRLLNHLRQGKPVDGSLVSVLRLGSMAALLRRSLDLDRGATAALAKKLLWWNRERERGRGTADVRPQEGPTLTWYLPDYKLVIVKNGSSIGALGDLPRRAVTLLGKDRALCDVALDHPSCSGQHAALEASFAIAAPVEEDLLAELAAELRRMGVSGGGSSGAAPVPPSQGALFLTQDEGRLSELCDWLWRRLATMQWEEWRAAGGGDDSGGEAAERPAEGGAHGASAFWSLELLLTDLGSTNGTRVNGTPLAAFTPTPLIEGDVLTFGASSRQYVVMRSHGGER